MMLVNVRVSGCDDETNVLIDVTNDQWAFLQELAQKISAASKYDCMPVMAVKVAPPGGQENDH